MKKIYQTPALLLLPVDPQDIITLSDETNGNAMSWSVYDEIFH